MRQVIVLVLTTVLLSACARREGPPPVTSPFHPITTVAGLSVLPPPEPGWIIVIQETNQVVLVQRSLQSGEHYGAAASIYPLPEIGSDQEFLKHVSAARAAAHETARVTIVKNDEALARERPARCVRYHTVSEDKTGTGTYTDPTVLQSIGYHCQHPENPRIGVNLEYSHRYAFGQADEHLEAKAAEFLHTIEFRRL